MFSLLFQCPADVVGFDSEPRQQFYHWADVQKKRHNNFQKEELNRPLSFCREVHIPLGTGTLHQSAAHLLMGGAQSKEQITSQRLLDQSQAGVYMGKTPHTPPFWPFWAYSRTLPQGVELLV